MNQVDEEINDLVKVLEEYEKAGESKKHLDRFTQAIHELNELHRKDADDVQKKRIDNYKKTYCRLALKKMSDARKNDIELLVLYIRLFANHLKSEFNHIKINDPLLMKGWEDYLSRWKHVSDILGDAMSKTDFVVQEYRKLN